MRKKSLYQRSWSEKNEFMNQKGYSRLNVNFNSSHRKNHPVGEE